MLEPIEGPANGPTAAGVTYALLTSAVTGKDRARILAGIADGAVDLVVGTHALVQEGSRSTTCRSPSWTSNTGSASTSGWR